MLSKTGKPDEAKVLYRAEEAVQAEKSKAEKQKRRRTQK